MIECAWCGDTMRRIGAVETGLLVGRASVWLCRCGHEREIFDNRLPLGYWRHELLDALFVRACDLSLAEREKRWRATMAEVDAARAEGERLLRLYGTER